MNTIKVIDLKDKRIGFKKENLNILRLTRDHVNVNKDYNINKTSLLLNFTSLNPLDNNYFKRY